MSGDDHNQADHHINGNMTSAECPVCRKRVRVVNPPGGDGTARVFVRHPPSVWPKCAGSRGEVSS